MSIIQAPRSGASARILDARLAAGLALAACSPYDPDLGATPYECGTAEPRCPERYACMNNGAKDVCVLAGALLHDARPDGADFECAMDGMLEPNDGTAEAFQTDVGTGALMRIFGPISLCPEGDQDYFQINLSAANQGIEVITRWESGMPVTGSILNRAGTLIANGTAHMALGPNALRACAPNLPVEVYYARALSLGNQKNNYRIEMKVVANCTLAP